jgi:hypothetical protein
MNALYEEMLEACDKQCSSNAYLRTYADIYREQQDQEAVRSYVILQRIESRIADIEAQFSGARCEWEKSLFATKMARSRKVKAKKLREQHKAHEQKEKPCHRGQSYKQSVFAKYVIGWRWIALDGFTVEEQTLQYYEQLWQTFVYDSANYGEYKGAWKNKKTYDRMVEIARAVAELRTALAI